MPLNNNTQKTQSAVARLAELPLVRLACNQLSVLYSDTKHSHTHLKTVCEVLEKSVTALGSAACEKVSPVIVTLKPQIFTVNVVACKGLDWLETTFPVLHTPTEQVVAMARNKVHGVQDVVNMAVNGTMDCVQYTVARLVEGMQQVNDTDQSLVEMALSVAVVGLDSALNVSEALVDSVLPPTKEEQRDEAAAHLVNRFEPPALRRSFSVRLVSLSAKLCRRSYKKAREKMHSVQVMETLSRSTMARNIQCLPQYLQHQAVSVLFYISLMYNLCFPTSEQNQTGHVKMAAEASSPQQDIVQGHPQATPPRQLRRPSKMSALDNGCHVKGSTRR